MEEYMDAVRSHLTCNASEYDLNNYITYDYTNEQIDDNIGYFRECKIWGLSPYKALLFFYDHLNKNN
jgi:hypothetical protein